MIESPVPRRKTLVIGCAVTDEMDAAIAGLVKNGEYKNPAEYLRDVVRRDLIRRGKLGPVVPEAGNGILNP